MRIEARAFINDGAGVGRTDTGYRLWMAARM